MFPKITLVTPSFNQGRYLGDCIVSVLDQGYSNLEFIIVDGGSNDESVDVMRKYERHLAWWTSEKDFGQSDAINKGLKRSTGDVLNWLNSDDVLRPGALRAIADAYLGPQSALYAGCVEEFDQAGTLRVVGQDALSFRNMVRYWDRKGAWHQPGVFFSREAWELGGPLDTRLRYAMDYAFMCRVLADSVVVEIPKILAGFRHHSGSKTVSELDGFYAETFNVSQRWWQRADVRDPWRARIHTASRCLVTAGFQCMRGRYNRGALRIKDALNILTNRTQEAGQ